ncbi:hypothetical protein [Duganella sp. BuS-21]|uniref:hypothetical protein n=1 Tax=Duganella sp. BuS-21 TaxID=2943848 RepID=UPI0035A59B93
MSSFKGNVAGSLVLMMKSPIFSFYSFHLGRLWRAQPLVLCAVITSLLTLLVSAFVYFQQWQETNEAVSNLQRLVAETRRKPVSVTPDKSREVAVPDLPVFSSAELVDRVNQIAVGVGIPFDEVSYRLEAGASTPYLRYRVTFSTAAKYPLIRRFIDQMAMNLPHTTLDEISCSRDDIPAAALSCDLSFSAFFHKDGHG